MRLILPPPYLLASDQKLEVQTLLELANSTVSRSIVFSSVLELQSQTKTNPSADCCQFPCWIHRVWNETSLTD